MRPLRKTPFLVHYQKDEENNLSVVPEQPDKKILEMCTKISTAFPLLSQIDPTKKSQEEIIALLKSGKGDGVSFEYPPLKRDPSEAEKLLVEVREQLDKTKMHSEVVESWRKNVNDIAVAIEILKNRGNEIAGKLAIEKYGLPTSEAVKIAKSALSVYRQNKPAVEHSVSSSQVLEKFQKATETIGITGWKFVIDPNLLAVRIRIKKEEKIISLGESANFCQDELDALMIHEFVHILRAESGKMQRYAILGYSTAEYLETEEGLTEYLGRLKIDPNIRSERMIAPEIRIVAVDLATRCSIQGVYDSLREYGISHGTATATAIRVKRGVSSDGVFPKDRVYFEGVQKVKRYLSGFDGDEEKAKAINFLLCGKFGIEDVPWVQKLNLRPSPFGIEFH